MLSYLALIVVITACRPSDAQMFFSPSGMGGAVGCVVTGNQLYSHGNYIRDLNNTEISQVQKYKEEMIVFQKKFDEALKDVFQISQNETFPVLPRRPAVPNFCFGKDTLLYVFAGCTVQNYKLYIGQKFARELTSEERMELDKFAEQLSATPRPIQQNAGSMRTRTVTSVTKTTTTTTPPPPPTLPPSLDFCTEF